MIPLLIYTATRHTQFMHICRKTSIYISFKYIIHIYVIYIVDYLVQKIYGLKTHHIFIYTHTHAHTHTHVTGLTHGYKRWKAQKHGISMYLASNKEGPSWWVMTCQKVPYGKEEHVCQKRITFITQPCLQTPTCIGIDSFIGLSPARSLLSLYY